MHKFAFIMILAAILVPAMVGYVHKAREVQERVDEKAVSYDEYYDEYDYDYDSYEEY